jgi:hypothetical protein
MTPNPQPEPEKHPAIPTASAVLDSGEILEMIFQPREKRTFFVRFADGVWGYESEVSLSSGERLVPYSPRNNLLKHEVVLLPSEPEEYGSDSELLGEIRSFIHRYVDVSPLFEEIASYYVLLSWVYDAFNELPYLRARGDFGSGKTRLLLTVGSICYKPIFASGASTVSPLFRIIDAFRGTLIIDEGDFRLSDEKAEVVKILNNGNARGFPVLRSEVSGGKEFDPRAYTVFGPKLVASRGFFEDRALESRFLTEEMGQGRLREDIPINLPESQKEEALHLRNKLLLFRLRNLRKPRALEDSLDRSLEPRLNQIFSPLLSIVDDPKAQEDLKELARRYDRELVSDRGMETEAQLLEVIRDLAASSTDSRLTVKEIASLFADRHGEDYERKVTPKWIGLRLRKTLNLKPWKSHGNFVILAESPRLEHLYEKYGIAVDPEPQSNMDLFSGTSGTWGDVEGSGTESPA